MDILDIIIIVLVIIGFILGFKDGAIRKVIGFIGFIAAIYLAISFAGVLGPVMQSVFSIEEYYLAEIIAGIIIFVLIIVVTALIKRIVHPHDKVNNKINQIIGGAMGIFQILFFLSAVLFLLNIFDVPNTKTRSNSLFYKPVYGIIPKAVDVIKKVSTDPKLKIKQYIRDKDTTK
ncbi:MAG TPA: CvpA family protein [Ignavibacteriaceae bacterium]|nr:CvpA family protein [Ignavibacteriaceae bacterium]